MKLYLLFFFIFTNLLAEVKYYNYDTGASLLEVCTKEFAKAANLLTEQELRHCEFLLPQKSKGLDLTKPISAVRVQPNLKETLPISDLKNDRVMDELIKVNVLGIIVMGALYLAPASVTNWNKGKIKSTVPHENYFDNISDGPVWDKDDGYINYVLHPYWGMVYYNWGIEMGLTDSEANTLSWFMSTFFWEYGWESLAEVPSIQDLILTPTVGVFMGRYSQVLKQKIHSQGDRLFGSKVLAKLTLFLMNPISPLIDSADRLTKSLKKYGLRADYGLSIANQNLYLSSPDPQFSHQPNEYYLKPTPIFEFRIRF